MDADRRAALVQQGKALKAQLADLEVHLQQLDSQLQVRSSPVFCTCMLVLNVFQMLPCLSRGQASAMVPCVEGATPTV